MRDLIALWKRIALDSVRSADGVVGELFQRFQLIARHPRIGHHRPDVDDTRYRFYPVYAFLIAYRVDAKQVRIVRVFDGRRRSLDVLGRRRKR